MFGGFFSSASSSATSNTNDVLPLPSTNAAPMMSDPDGPPMMVDPDSVPSGVTPIAIWVSIDPRSGDVHVYPRNIVQALETAFGANASQVSLRGFGSLFDDKTVIFDGGTSHGNKPIQRSSAGGARDVRRIRSGDAEISIHVYRERGWRIADECVPGVTQEKKIHVVQQLDVAASSTEDGLSIACRTAAAASAAKGMEGLWEWCQILGAKDISQVPSDQWGLYTEEHNTAIEKAFAAGEPSVQICIGIRTYDIIFSGPTSGKQVDTKLRKRRQVRRCEVPKGEVSQRLEEAISNMQFTNSADASLETCAVCYCDFADTPTMPTVQLPGCGHRFHGACVQQLADQRETCPLCRADVDWNAAFASVGR